MTLRTALILLPFSLASASEKVGYNADIRPILSDKCFLCHGPDEANNKAGLRLDTPEAAYAALKESDGHAIVSGSLEKSQAWQRIISTDPSKVMPTPESNLKLTREEKSLIAKWIEQGAEYEPHWSFVPLPEKVEVPKSPQPEWAKNPIDHFVAAQLETNSLQPSPESEPHVWLRRVTFDLTGLPPTLEELKAFASAVKAEGEEAYRKTVDRLMSTIEYGEHMALDWLDAARYADTFGYHSDMDFTPWPYRDWVVKAFQEDLPYDEFVTWNIAGDLLPEATREQRLATAFNRLHRITNEGGSNYLEFFVDGVSDRVNTVGTAFLGLTMECAKCHDHKYDPITQKDYFQLYAFFNSINETGVYNHGKISPPPSLLLPSVDQETELKKLQQNATNIEDQLTQMRQNTEAEFQAWKTSILHPPSAATPPDGPANVTHPEPVTLTIADQTAHLDFEKSADKPLESRIQPLEPRMVYNKKKKKEVDAGPIAAVHRTPNGDKKPATLIEAGPEGLGSAASLDGDYGFIFEHHFHKDRYDPFSIGLWIKDTQRSSHQLTIAQRTHGHDVGYNGLDLNIQDGHLIARIYRAWPDNGIGVKSKTKVPQNTWHHVTWTWDGSARHDGFALYLDGKKLEVENLGYQLYKNVGEPTYQVPGRFSVGALFRGRGFKGGQIDDLTTFDRALTPVEIKHLAGLRNLNESLAEGEDEAMHLYYLSNHHAEYRQKLAKLQKAYKAISDLEDTFTEIPTMVEMDEARPAYLLARGEFDAPRNKDTLVERDSLSFLLPFPEDAPRDRLGLAKWLTLPNHPLTSRVFVNRIWQQFFGTGLVGTAENFGLQGDLPTHPQLLDWLCRDLINNSWSTKHLVQQIVLSATYRQKSALTPELQSMDIANKFLARGPAYRLSGEQIRDSALATSGLLSDERGGKPVRPYDPIRNRNPKADQVHRRSLYTYWRRTRPQNNMIIFDKPSLEVCSVKRTRTNSPAQALVLLNDVQFIEAARNLATTMIQKFGDDATRMATAWKKVTSREPSEKEKQLLGEILAEQKSYFSERQEDAQKLLKMGLEPLPDGLDPVESAALTVVCQAIYNTDAAIWKR